MRKLLSIFFSLPMGAFCLLKENAKNIYYSVFIKNAKIKYTARVANSSFEKGTWVGEHSQIFNCSVGKYTYITKYCEINFATIGNFCSLGPYLLIGLGEHPLDRNVSTSTAFHSSSTVSLKLISKDTFEPFKKVVIGHDVWIGARSIILGGITIGNGAVVATGSVVTKDIPAYAVVGGIPAKVIKFRFTNEEIRMLEELEWWYKDESWLKENIYLFNNIDLLIEKFGHK